MADEKNDGAEAWGRRSHVRLDDLPRADPIAYLGTERHPLSVPPTTHDVVPSASLEKGTEAATRAHASRRLLATAIGLAIVLPMAVRLSSTDDVAPAPSAGDSRFTPAREQGAQAAPADLPPGGIFESALPEAEPKMSSERSVADWTTAPQMPAGDTAVADAPREEPRAAVPALRRTDSSTPARETPLRSPATKARSVGSFGAPFDFTAAMNAVAATSVGPVQCGPDAIGPTPVEITFAPSGHATRAVIQNGPLRGSDAGSCVARSLRRVQIAPFSGDAATVHTTVLLR